MVECCLLGVREGSLAKFLVILEIPAFPLLSSVYHLRLAIIFHWVWKPVSGHIMSYVRNTSHNFYWRIIKASSEQQMFPLDTTNNQLNLLQIFKKQRQNYWAFCTDFIYLVVLWYSSKTWLHGMCFNVNTDKSLAKWLTMFFSPRLQKSPC